MILQYNMVYRFFVTPQILELFSLKLSVVIVEVETWIMKKKQRKSVPSPWLDFYLVTSTKQENQTTTYWMMLVVLPNFFNFSFFLHLLGRLFITFQFKHVPMFYCTSMIVTLYWAPFLSTFHFFYLCDFDYSLRPLLCHFL